ncbi:MAG: Phosphatidate cytidylyltransferase [Deltaproteobacteria bacterium ADurb.Bin510]|nr:MAG: Phosphatidate cytidylyltransferase [Deltaproteobacteria bacterium ADurb.Bin510]
MKRILGALLFALVLAAPAVFGPPVVFLAVMIAVTLCCTFELNRITLRGLASWLGYIPLVGSPFFLGALYAGSYQWALGCLLICTLMILALGLILFERELATAHDLGFALMSLIYPVSLAGCWVAIRGEADGLFLMLWGMICTFAADTGAYYAGRTFGRHSLAPRLSPKKTIEGLVGGVVLCLLVGVALPFIFDYLAGRYGFSPIEGCYPLWGLGLTAGLIAFVGLMGDLTASLFKREFGIKDAGHIIPGHGGMLDRMDGTLPVGAFLFIVLKVFF